MRILVSACSFALAVALACVAIMAYPAALGDEQAEATALHGYIGVFLPCLCVLMAFLVGLVFPREPV